MSRTRIIHGALVFSVSAVWVAWAASAATLIPVAPVAGSVGAAVFDINDNNIIVGSWYDSQGNEHGFFGSLDGNYTTFDYTAYPNIGTEPRGINNEGYIAGHAWIDNVGDNYQFVRKPDGSIATVTKRGRPLNGIAQGITVGARFVGNYYTRHGRIDHAFVGQDGHYTADVALPFDTNLAAARGINSLGDIVGYFVDASRVRHGFLARNGTAAQIDYSPTTQTVVEDINDQGIATGQVLGRRFFAKSFILDTNTNAFRGIEWRNNTQAYGLNNNGLIAIDILDGANPGPYIYCPRRPKHCPASHGAIEVPDSAPIKLPAELVKSYPVDNTAIELRRKAHDWVGPKRNRNPYGLLEP